MDPDRCPPGTTSRLQAHRRHSRPVAARADCERALGEYLLQRLGAGHLPTVHELEQRFDPPAGEASLRTPGACVGFQHPLAGYNTLLPSQCTEVH